MKAMLAQDFVENKRVLLGIFSILLILGFVGESAVKLLWYDELSTLYIDAQPKLSQMLGLIFSVHDLNPPLFHILTWLSLRMPGDQARTARLHGVTGVG